jgi:hypothetical protein
VTPGIFEDGAFVGGVDIEGRPLQDPATTSATGEGSDR